MAPLTSRRRYANTGPAATLPAGINAAVTAFSVSSGVGWPAVPFTASLDFEGAAEEIILVTGMAGAAITACTRGYDGTAAQPHDAGAAFVHTAVAKDHDEANEHSSGTAAHGTAGAVVGTTDAQTLTNKVISSSRLQATASDMAVKAQAAASGSASLIEGLDSAGAGLLFKVGRQGDTFINPTDPAKSPLVLKGAAAQAADSLEIQNSDGEEIFVVDAKGRIIQKPSDITAPSVKYVPPNSSSVTYLALRDAADAADQFVLTTDGKISSAALLWLRGFFADDPIRYPLNGSLFKVTSAGAMTVAGALTAGGAVAAAGAVTGSNLPAVPAAKAGKRFSWGSATANTDGSGYATITHGLGFTPVLVVATWTGQGLGGMNAQIAGTDSYTSTQFRLRAINALNTSFTVGFVGFEA